MSIPAVAASYPVLFGTTHGTIPSIRINELQKTVYYQQTCRPHQSTTNHDWATATIAITTTRKSRHLDNKKYDDIPGDTIHNAPL